MTGLLRTSVKFGAFSLIMVLLSTALFAIFGQFRGGPSRDYSALFADASDLEKGDSVRVGGLRVGTVHKVSLQPDNTVLVTFDTDPDVALTTSSKAVVRYLNLIGDRYLELQDGAGPTTPLPPGSRIGLEHTAPALDLDLLLGGLKPVIRGLNPQDVNALTASLLEIFQGEGDTMQSLMSRTSSFSNTVADNNAATEQLIDNLNKVVATLGKDGEKFSGAIDKFERLISGLSTDRDTIGTAIDSLDNGTASVADLLSNARAPLAGTVQQLSRLAPLLDNDKGVLDVALQRAPDNFRRLARMGSYGSFVNYYLCGISMRVTDLQGQTAVFPWIKQDDGRCAEP